MPKDPKIYVSLHRKPKKKQLNRSAKARAHDAKLSRLCKTDPRYLANTDPTRADFRKSEGTKMSETKGAKRITEALRAYITDPAPPHLCREAGLEEGATYAEVIAVRQLIIAAGGSLASTQYSQDVSEGKMSGPGQSPISAAVAAVVKMDFGDKVLKTPPLEE
jgi:hypothetical protein